MARVSVIAPDGTELGYGVERVNGTGPLVELTLIDRGVFVSDKTTEDELVLMPFPEVPDYILKAVELTDRGIKGGIGVQAGGAPLVVAEPVERTVRGLVTQAEIEAAAAEAAALREAEELSALHKRQERWGAIFGEAWHNGKRLA